VKVEALTSFWRCRDAHVQLRFWRGGVGERKIQARGGSRRRRSVKAPSYSPSSRVGLTSVGRGMGAFCKFHSIDGMNRRVVGMYSP
jgi:hypothetical protein